MRGKVPEVFHRQRNTFANSVEHRVRNGHVHIPSNTVSAGLHLYILKIVRLLEKNLKCLRIFKMLLQIALLHYEAGQSYGDRAASQVRVIYRIS